MMIQLQKIMLMAVIISLSSPLIAEDKLATPKEVDYSYITAETIFTLSLYPNRVLTNPDNKLYPLEVISAAGIKELGIDPVDIKSILGVVEPPMNSPMPGIGIILKTTKAYSIDQFLPNMKNQYTEGELDGKSYRKAATPMGVSIYKQDEKTIIFATEPFLEKLLKTKKEPVESPLKKQIPKNALQSDILATLYLDPVKPMLAGVVAMAPIPPEFEELKSVPELISFIQIRLNLNSDFNAKLSLFAKDEEEAEILESVLNKAIADFRNKFLNEIPDASPEPVERAMGQYMKRISEYYANAVRPTRKGTEIFLEGKGSEMSHASTTGVLIAMLLPAVQQARAAARRTQSKNNLKQIALAFHNYHDIHQTFPARSSFDKNGNPLLSWRVHILPFIEEGALYSQFKLDEPWDSENNKKLISQMPAMYGNPNSKEKNFKTNYLLPVGKGTLFEGKQALRMRDIVDGTSNTIIAVEADQDQSVIWTKPEDLSYNPDKPMTGLGNLRPGGFHVLKADGSVRFISVHLNEDILQALMTFAGGEAINNF
jgi:type II secretory pathway pseudopilin PulG